MLELIDLHKHYGDRQVLDGAWATVHGGESLALVGANGSGKTTMLRSVVGLQHLDAGTVRIDGITVAEQPRAARARMSYLPQRSEFPLTLTVSEILHVVAELRGLPPAAASRELALCGLDTLASRTVSRLSGGERQRVALAVLLMPAVSLYLLDEPTANLDAEGTEVLVDRVRELRDAGRSIVFTTHVGADVERLATRVARLRDGRIESLNEHEEDRHHEKPHCGCAGPEPAAGVAVDWLHRHPCPGAAAAGSH